MDIATAKLLAQYNQAANRKMNAFSSMNISNDFSSLLPLV